MAETSVILRDAARPRGANKQLRFIIGGAVVLSLIVYLIVTAVQGAGSYYREVREVLTQQSALAGKPVRVSGNVVTESITYDPAKLDLNFKISDLTDPSKQLPVRFHGVKPDQLSREGAAAIVEGTLGDNGTVSANNLLIKCPSRYEEYEDEIKVEAVK